MNDEFYWTVVTAVTVISAARLTRLVVKDKFPPVLWARKKFLRVTDTTRLAGWQLLVFCVFCVSFWATALIVCWGLWADVYGPGSESPDDPVAFMIWMGFNGTLAASYVAAMIAARDGGDDD